MFNEIFDEKFFDEKIDELYFLSKQINRETKAYVQFTMSACGCDMSIWDDKESDKKKSDGHYLIYYSIFPRDSLKDYEAAKEHIQRLLQETGNNAASGSDN